LRKDPTERLGSKNGISDIKTHAFFDGIDWKTLSKEIAPYVPKAGKELDTSNFPMASKDDLKLKMLIETEGLDGEF